MILFQAILAMLAIAVGLLAFARWSGLPYPVLLALAGVAVASAPLEYRLELDPQLVLALFVAPVLLNAAYDTSLRDLRQAWRSLLSLAVIAVGVTTAAVAVLVHSLVPELPWSVAIVLGAIVAPPDAVTAMTVLKEIQLPHRLKVILEGEALLNDASTLLIYTLGIAAVAGGGGIGAEIVAPTFALSILGSVVAGPLLAWILGRIIARITDTSSSIILQFVSTFGVWIIAERLHLSPVLTVVSYAMVLARSRTAYQDASLRIPSFAVWDTSVLVVNILAFLLIGLELRPALEAAPPGAIGRWSVIGGAILLTIIAVRLTWTLGTALAARWHLARRQDVDNNELPDWRTGLVVGWAGSRGIVTVSTALALPGGFPGRSMLLFLAVFITLGTLLIQGLTLKPLVRVLSIGGDDIVDSEVRSARAATATAALSVLEGESGPDVRALRDELANERDVASAAREGEGRPNLPANRLRARILQERSRCLFNLRQQGNIGDDAFHRLEEEFDLAQLATAMRG